MHISSPLNIYCNLSDHLTPLVQSLQYGEMEIRKGKRDTNFQ